MRLLTGLMLSLAAALPARADFAADLDAARQARAQGQPARAEPLLRQALAERPGHPTALYELALTQAQAGQAERALDTLERLARQGLAYDIAGDSGFAALAGKGRFKRLQREFQRNRDPRGRAQPHFRLLDPQSIPKSLAFDPDTARYFVGSAHLRRIDRVRRGGKVEDFVAPGQGGLWAPMGLAADPRRRLLWVASAAVPQMMNAAADELGRSAILAYDLDSGAPKRRYDLKEPGTHLLGDLVVRRDGMIFTTDSRAGVLYALDSTTGRFEALTSPGQLAAPRGLALTRDGRHLYLADYGRGLFRFHIGDRELERVEADDDISLYGIDSLSRYEDQLVAVQTGIRPHRVLRLELSGSGRRVRRAEVLAANLPDFDEPAQGVVVGRRFSFIANSQWGRFDARHRLPAKEQLRRPVVLRVDIAPEGSGPRRDGGPAAPPPSDPGIVPPLPILR